MEQSEFEKKVMEKILNSPEKPYCILKNQYLNATITSRKLTQVGFFTNFKVPNKLIVPGMKGLIMDVYAKFDNSDSTCLFILFVRSGKIDFLEGVMSDGDRPSKYDKAILCYAFKDRRQHEIENYN